MGGQGELFIASIYIFKEYIDNYLLNGIPIPYLYLVLYALKEVSSKD